MEINDNFNANRIMEESGSILVYAHTQYSCGRIALPFARRHRAAAGAFAKTYKRTSKRKKKPPNQLLVYNTQKNLREPPEYRKKKTKMLYNHIKDN